MDVDSTPELIHEFLGSAHIFASAVSDRLERKLLGEVAGDRLTFSQLKLLKVVSLTDAHSIGDVAAFLGVTSTAASKAVDKLVRGMLLRRTEGEADRRSSQLSLTTPGRELLAAYDAVRNQKLQQIFGECSPEQLRVTRDLLDRLSAVIVDHTAKAEEICLQCGIYFRERCPLREYVRRTCFYQRHKARKGASAPSPPEAAT
ncbi:MAG: MarR family transcriptional regulator [Bryobacteraceae bacterium]|jgi:DNA-binding MarR family transcriptional regulator